MAKKTACLLVDCSSSSLGLIFYTSNYDENLSKYKSYDMRTVKKKKLKSVTLLNVIAGLFHLFDLNFYLILSNFATEISILTPNVSFQSYSDTL